MSTAQSEIERVNTLLVKDRLPGKCVESNTLEESLYQDGIWAWFNRTLGYAGIGRSERIFLFYRAVFWAALSFSVAALGHTLIALSLAPILLLFETSNIKHKISERVKGFELDYSALLLSLASSIKSGADPIFAMGQTVNLFPQNSIMWHEVSIFRSNIERGVAEDKSLSQFAATINYPDLDLFRVAMILARKEGSSLGESLQRLAKVTRQRQSFARKIKSAVAMQKMAALGIAGCSILIGVIQYFANPEAFKTAWSHPVGHNILITGIFLLVFGLIWIRKIASQAT